MQNLMKELKETLQKDDRFFKEDALFKNVVIEFALKLDKDLLKMLYSNETLKKHFFIKVDNITIFDKDKFIRFVSNKEFLPDSFTSFKNKIGLMTDDKYFSEIKDVVIAWPYKDCVLEGGMTKEDQKRDEVFYNEVLAPDDINRLYDPKVMTNFKRYDEKGEHTLKKSDKINFENENLIIKGNNLLALHSFKKKYAGKVKLIYIDPPYNTGNDSFKYNDSFNHSTWLTFMKNRLEIARELLSNDGLICIQCDNNEQAYLKVLADEIFGKINFRNNIIWRKVLSAKKQSSNLSNITEHILFYSKKETFSINKQFIKAEEEKDLKNYPYIEEGTNRKYGSFDFTQKGKGEPKYFNGKLLTPPNGKHWIWDQNKINEGIKKGLIIFTSNGTPRVKRYLDEKEGNPLSDLWNDDEVKIISANDKERLEFDGQKPEALLKRIIELSTEKDDLVIDFFSGTGTTASVSHKLKRKWVIIEQISYNESDCFDRLKNVIKGDQTGISKSVNWQGGGSFIFCELMQCNEIFITKIQKAKSKKELITIWEEIKHKAFLSYKVDIKKIEKNISLFEDLSIENQKKFLIEVLDKNSLYVNYSEIDDKEYNVSEDDKKLNKIFYGE